MASQTVPREDHISVPRTLFATVISGMVAGVVMGLVLHFVMYMMPLIASLYGRQGIVNGWALHLAHSVVLAFPLTIAISLVPLREHVTSLTRAAAVGIVYGVVLWILLEGLILPTQVNAALPASTGPLYLPIDGLVAHVLYGGTLGFVYATLGGTVSEEAGPESPDARPS